MITGSHQSLYLAGHLGLWNKLASCDQFILLDNVQISRSDYVHRNRIIINGKPVMLTNPIGKHKYQPLIKEVYADRNVLDKHKRQIELSYKKSNFYEDYKHILECFDLTENLSQLNRLFIETIGKELDITPDIYSDDCYNTKSTTGSDLILELCKESNTSTYLSGAHGKDYMDLDYFRIDGIDVLFQNFAYPDDTYASVLHYLFTYGPDTKNLIQDGEWIG